MDEVKLNYNINGKLLELSYILMQYVTHKFDGVLDEEHRDVVADNVPVAFRGVKPRRETSYISDLKIDVILHT